MTSTNNAHDNAESIRTSNSTLQRIEFVTALMKEISDSLFIENKASIIIEGDDCNYESLLQIKEVESMLQRQGAQVMLLTESKRITILVRI